MRAMSSPINLTQVISQVIGTIVNLVMQLLPLMIVIMILGLLARSLAPVKVKKVEKEKGGE